MGYYQQGDVLVVPEKDKAMIKKIMSEGERISPKGEKAILAEGESTGHMHSMPAMKAHLYRLAGQMYLHVLKACMLKHQEHRAFKVSEGVYKVNQIQEVNPLDKQVRAVQD